MTKRELIDEILAINHSASPSFLARFTDVELDEYLAHLQVLGTPRLQGDPARYEKYFRNCPTIRAPRPQWRETPEQVEDVAIEIPNPAEEFDEEPPEGSPALDYAELDLQPDERHQLYVQPADPADEQDAPDETLQDFGEHLPAGLVVSPAPAPADGTGPLFEQDGDHPDARAPRPQDAPGQAVLTADAPADDDGDGEDDSDAWLY